MTLVADALRTRRLHYVGIDNNAAGRTAGSLLGRFVGRREATVAIVLGSGVMRDQVERQLGFCQVMARDFPEFRVLPPLVGQDRLNQDPVEEVDRSLRSLRAAADDIPYLPPAVPTQIFLRDNLP